MIGKLKQTDGRSIALFIFEAAMAVLYLVFGVIFLFTSLFDVALMKISGPDIHSIKIVLGAILGLYGIFRIYRAVKKLI
ncbi:MAG: hypothetical protein LBP72_02715 [Dysgonamonadaceae bacterium]|jgi:hypothetical protein|nr:hypothetical protein [Dysgonamonadaceae bacterium]